MTNILLLLIILLMANQRPFYFAGVINCNDRNSCLHEIGHAVDDVSQSHEYQQTVYTYLGTAMVRGNPTEHEMKTFLFPGIGTPRLRERSPLSDGFWFGGWGGWRELYASMLAWADGDPANMPEAFTGFYDWDEIHRLEVLYGNHSSIWGGRSR